MLFGFSVDIFFLKKGSIIRLFLKRSCLHFVRLKAEEETFVKDKQVHTPSVKDLFHEGEVFSFFHSFVES